MTFETLLADNDVPQQKKRIIRVVNILSVSTAITVFILGPYLYSITGYVSILIPAFVEGTLFMLVPILNNYGKNQAALRLMYIVHTVAVGYFTLILGPSSNVLAFSIFLCVSAVTIFTNWVTKLMVILMIIAMATGVQVSHRYDLYPTLILDWNALKNLDWTVNISVYVLTISILYSHDFESRLNEKEKEILRRKLDWSNKELGQLNKELDHANKSKSVYIRHTVHDLRAPMNIILRVVQEYENDNKKDYKSETVPLTLKDFDDLYSTSMSLLQIINNNLVWSRIEAGEQEELNITRFKVHKWLSKDVHAKKRLAPIGKDVRLYADTGNLPKSVMIDEGKLQRILTNLLSNAFKFTKNDTPVIIRGKVEDDKLVFTVEDKGPGIPEHMLETIFSPFYTDSSQKTESSGFGLPIVKEMIRILGGDLFVKSDIGIGTAFKVVLPLVLPETEESEEEEEIEPTYYLQGKNVMVIDDEEMQLTITNHFLTKLGASIMPFHKRDEESYEVINLIEAFMPDVLLLDLYMPKVSGKNLMIDLLEHPNCSHIPIIILSGDSFKESQDELLKLGASGFISKPFILKDFNKTIYDVLYSRTTDSQISV